jgi:hypothetical protein
MNPPRPPVKLASAVLQTVLERADLAPEAAAVATGAPDAAAALLRILQAGMMADAARFMAHALPKREAVWWACMCARATAPEPPPPDAAAVAAAEAWVRKPEEELRRAAMAKAEAAGFRSPEAWAAVAAFWSGGSMAPPGQPVVPPAEHLTGVAVAGSVSLSAVRREPEKAEATLKRFVESGLDIAAGGSGRIAPG